MLLSEYCDLEALEATASIRQFRVHIEQGATYVTMLTRHATLTRPGKQRPETLSKRQVGWIEFLQPYYSNYPTLQCKMHGTANVAGALYIAPAGFCVRASYCRGMGMCLKLFQPHHATRFTACDINTVLTDVVSDDLMLRSRNAYATDYFFSVSGRAVRTASKYTFGVTK